MKKSKKAKMAKVYTYDEILNTIYNGHNADLSNMDMASEALIYEDSWGEDDEENED